MSDLLKALGSRGDVVCHLDFETYYDGEYSLRKLTTEGYVRDPRFEVLGVGVAWGDLPPVWLEAWEFRAWAQRVDWSRVAVNAHHTQFDGFILSHHYGIRPRFLYCTMSLARAIHGGGKASIEFLGPHYGLGEKGDALEGVKGKRRRDLTQTHWQKLGDYCRQDVVINRGALAAMVVGFPVKELWLIDTTIRQFTEPVFQADVGVLQEALVAEVAKKDRLLERVGGGDFKEIVGSSEKFAALLRQLGEEPPTKVGKKGEIYAFAKDDPGMQELLEHHREDVRFLAEARLAVKSTITETRTERIIGVASRGAVPFYLKYCGAHTHRWSGGDKMNPQNFNRGGALRDAILAPDGHVLVVADSGQIEARVLAWVAGSKSLLDTFRRNDSTGGDFYSDVGSQFFLKKISKKETPVERQLSKNMVLGLGFGMGWAKFALELLKGMLGSDPVQFTGAELRKFGVNLAAFVARPFGKSTCGEHVRTLISRLPYEDLLVHTAVADHFVRLYRQRNPEIVRLWRTMTSVIERMASGTDEPTTRVGCLTIRREAIVKPNGLVLHYPGLHKRKSGEYVYRGGNSGREFVKIYGGLLTENVVQSLARDIVAEQALRVRASGRRLGTTTHDELVAVVPKADGERALEFTLSTMRVPPAWCADLPLNASGGFGTSYGAVK